jgi:hypothetical protein
MEKSEVLPVHVWSYIGRVQVYLLSFFASTMDREYGQLQGPAPPRNKPSTHWREGSVDPRAGLDGFGEDKIAFPLPGLDPRTVQAVASRYTDDTNPVYNTKMKKRT